MKKKTSEISLKSIYNTIDENTIITIVRNNRDATTHARNKTSKHIEKITISPRKSANTSKKLSRFRFHDEKLQKSKIYYKKLIKLRARFVHTRAASTCTTKTLAGSSLERPVSTSRRSVPLYRPVLLKRTPFYGGIVVDVCVSCTSQRCSNGAQSIKNNGVHAAGASASPRGVENATDGLIDSRGWVTVRVPWGWLPKTRCLLFEGVPSQNTQSSFEMIWGFRLESCVICFRIDLTLFDLFNYLFKIWFYYLYIYYMITERGQSWKKERYH